MSQNSWEILKERLLERLQPHGATSEFCRKTGFYRSVVERWLEDDGAVPGIDKLDRIAEAMGLKPWEAIRPDAEAPAEDPRKKLLSALPTLDDLEIELVANYTSALQRRKTPPGRAGSGNK